jgi:hypothetical protein
MNAELLKELGLDTAAAKVSHNLTLQKKMLIAYEHFRFVEPHVFDRFQAEIKSKTLRVHIPCPQCENKEGKKQSCGYCQRTGAQHMTHDKLAFVDIKSYTEVPPMDCLMDLKKAKDLNCFDTFEVAKVETVDVRPDPVIFGLINGCVDKFYITQWDDDVKIEDILRENEG